jgi:predicted small secreted protein
MKKLFVLFCVSVTLTGCSTVAGMGKDLTTTAEWTKEKMK